MINIISFTFDPHITNPIVDDQIWDFLIEVKKELDIFFEIDKKTFEIRYIFSRVEFDKVQNRRTKDWEMSCAGNNIIHIFHPDIYISKSNHKDNFYWLRLLKHEIVHLYHQELCNITKSIYPRWLVEGLACYLASQENYNRSEVLDIFQKDYNAHSLGFFWVEILYSKFGKNKLLKLIRKIGNNYSKKKFKKIFFELYGIKYSKKFFKKILHKRRK